jgi:negative regulator of flagellin synthesis FlgM
MSNKINGLDSRPIAIGGGSPVVRVGESATRHGEAAPAGPQNVRITDDARRLAELERAIGALPVVDELRVAELARAIEQGSFQVLPERIADRLLRQDLELAGARNAGSDRE